MSKKDMKNKSAAEKKKLEKQNKTLREQIPFSGVWDDMGMMETAPAVNGKDPQYSIAFRIDEVDAKSVIAVDPYIINRALAALLNGFPEDVSYQFYVVNSRTDEDSFLDKAVVQERDDITPEHRFMNKGIRLLNEAVKENAPVGHNNMIRKKYIIFTVSGPTPDEALKVFSALQLTAEDLFYNYCGLGIHILSAAERLELIYDVYNKSGQNFGARAGMTAETLSLDTLSRMKMSAKDLVIPRSMKEEKSDVLLNDNVYARVFFIANFPTYLSENLISELTTVSSTMIYSALYEPLPTDVGFAVAKVEAAKNIVITNHHEKRTLADQKAHRITRRTEIVNRSEEAYFTNSALDVLTDSMAADTKMFACSFLIVLFSDNLVDLERDTKLLTLSATKFAFQIKCLEYAQKKALSSALPLGRCYVDIKRVFSVEKLCSLNPMDISAALREDGLYAGVNAINNNIVLTNRMNSVKVCGLISGMRNAGKTFAVKRDVFNNLISSDDLIIVIADSREHSHYAPFITSLGGAIISEGNFDPLQMTSDYGVIEDGAALKKDFYAALFSQGLHIHEAGYSADEKKISALLSTEIDRFYEAGFKSLQDVSAYMEQHVNDLDFAYPTILRALKELDFTYISGKSQKGRRLSCFEISSSISLLIVLERVWNVSIFQKKQNRSMWIYIDSVDPVLQTPEGARYLKHLLSLSNVMRNPMTVVVQNSARFGSGENMYNLQNLFSEIGYYKLLNQGPIERRVYADALNIPGSLLPYVTNAPVGAGLIVSQSANIPFTDNMSEVLNDPKPMMDFFDPERTEQIQ